MATWHTATTARDFWAGAPKSDTLLAQLLAVSRDQIEVVMSSHTPAEDNVPARIRLAQVKNARAIWEEARANLTGDEAGLGDFAMTQNPASMGAAIRRLLALPVEVG
jgi:hypothetical protein